VSALAALPSAEATNILAKVSLELNRERFDTMPGLSPLTLTLLKKIRIDTMTRDSFISTVHDMLHGEEAARLTLETNLADVQKANIPASQPSQKK
jgi:hypothetical protein